MTDHPTITIRVTVRPWVVASAVAIATALRHTTPRRWHPAIADGLAWYVMRCGVTVR